MRRFYWLLALPWVVVSVGDTPKVYCVRTPDTVFWCSGKKSDMEDLAFLLNDAHERRTMKPISGYGQGIWTVPKKADWQDNFLCHATGDQMAVDEYQRRKFNKEACGSDDCGQDPK